MDQILYWQARWKNFQLFLQFLCMTLDQLIQGQNLRDIKCCFRIHKSKPNHIKVRGGITRYTLSNANKTHYLLIYANLALATIKCESFLFYRESQYLK
jgi:hypothetical protein